MNQHTQSTGGELEAIVKHHAPFFMKYETVDQAETQLRFLLRQTQQSAQREEMNYHLNVMQEIGNALSEFDHKSIESAKNVLHNINEIIKKDMQYLSTLKDN